VRLTYWCAFGPQLVPLSEVAVPPMRGTFLKDSPRNRPKAGKELFNNHLKPLDTYYAKIKIHLQTKQGIGLFKKYNYYK
jgi:hypothetical protein